MTSEDFKNIRILSAKERLDRDGLYLMLEEEKEELARLKKDFDTLDKTKGKTIFYMHDFLGISYQEIAEIINYTYGSVKARYFEIKDILTT